MVAGETLPGTADSARLSGCCGNDFTQNYWQHPNYRNQVSMP
jgi:hypothetical protein